MIGGSVECYVCNGKAIDVCGMDKYLVWSGEFIF